jgi:hypothetical protein
VVGWHLGKLPEAQISDENQRRNSRGRDRIADSARQKGTTIALVLVIIVLAFVLIARLLTMYFPHFPFP